MSSVNSSKLTAAVLRLALLIGAVTVMYYGRGLLLTLTLAGLLAALVNPIDNYLRERGWSPGLSITAAVLVIVLFFAGLFFAVGKQASNFVSNWGQTKQNLAQQIDKIQRAYPVMEFLPDFGYKGANKATNTDGGAAGAAQDLNAGPSSPSSESSPSITANSPGAGSGAERGENSSAGQTTFSEFAGGGGSQLMGYLGSTFGILGDFLLMFVYIILFLSQKSRLREFVLRRAPEESRGLTHRTLNESADVVQKYLRGRLILIGILSVLYSVGFLIVGVPYAILIALLVAVLSIIPYLGNIIGGAFAMAMAFAGGGGSYAIIGIFITMSIAQTLESYILTPLIVGDEVDINPLTTIICVIGMTILWGPVGAIIAIPLFAILRIIFSHVDSLKDWAYVMGTE